MILCYNIRMKEFLLMLIIYIVILAISITVELTTQNLVTLCIAIASFVAMFFVMFRWYVSFVIFMVLSILLILSLKPFLSKKFKKNQNNNKTGLDLLKGRKTIIVDSETKNNLASCKLNGVLWNVKEIDNKQLIKGDLIEIIKIDNNTLYCEKK